jgi:hypothetical protein
MAPIRVLLAIAYAAAVAVAAPYAVGPRHDLGDHVPAAPPELYAALPHKSGREDDLPNTHHPRWQVTNDTLPHLPLVLPPDSSVTRAWHAFGRYRARVHNMDLAGDAALVPAPVRESLGNATEMMVHFLAVVDAMREGQTYDNAVVADIWRRMLVLREKFVDAARLYFGAD